jgi:dTDP-4-amino-4,6-dideoxygalactose transaminase
MDGGKPIRSRQRFLTFGSPSIGKAEQREVLDSLRARWVGTGPKVARFETAFSSRYTPHLPGAQGVAVNSCTAALHLSILGLGIRPGDEVVTTPMTFCATVNAVLHAGAKPVPADVDPITGNLDPALAAARIGPKTRALLPVHFAGLPCDMDAFTRIAKRAKLRLIEDCAHAVETEWKGRPVGTFGHAACFSFYATKNMTTGEGGLILTASKPLADRLKRLALHGLSQDAWRRFSDAGYIHYDVIELGYKYNMMDIQAAMGIHQLAALEKNARRRARLWKRYQQAFADLPLELPAEAPSDCRHAYHLYAPRVTGAFRKKRDWVLSALTAEGMGTGVHYRALCDHPFYRKVLGWSRKDMPIAADIGDRTFSLPLSPALTDEDAGDVIRAVRKVFAG